MDGHLRKLVLLDHIIEMILLHLENLKFLSQRELSIRVKLESIGGVNFYQIEQAQIITVRTIAVLVFTDLAQRRMSPYQG